MRAAIAARFAQVMVDELEESTPAQRALLEGLAGDNPNQLFALEARASRATLDLVPHLHPDGERSSSSAASASRAALLEVRQRAGRGAGDGARGRAPARRRRGAEAICVLVADPAREGGAVAAAMEERGIPFHLAGPTALFQRAEVRDAIAWLRVLADPDDSAAAARALTRPPVELRPVDLARLTTIARRRKLDMVSACEAALDSPQFPPEARERIQAFLKLYGAAAAAMEERRADVFVRRLIERVGLRRQRLFAAQPEVAERLLGLSRLAELATAWTRREPHGSTRDFVALPQRRRRGGGRADRRRGAPAPGRGRGSRRRGQGDRVRPRLRARPRGGGRRGGSAGRRAPSWCSPGSTAARPRRPSRAYAEALAASGRRRGGARGGAVRPRRGPPRHLPHAARGGARGVLAGGARASEPRLDTAIDVNRAIARYLELLKLAALAQRPGEEATAEAIEAVNGLLRQVATPEQQAELDASSLDAYLLDSERERGRRRS